MELFRYLVCGITATIVSFVSYFAFLEASGSSSPLAVQAATAVSWACAVAVAVSFLISRSWVFGPGERGIRRELLGFVSGRLATLFVDLILMQVLVFQVGVSQLAAKAVVQVVVTVLNYLLGKFVFGGKKI